jgi:hypothetical protein
MSLKTTSATTSPDSSCAFGITTPCGPGKTKQTTTSQPTATTDGSKVTNIDSCTWYGISTTTPVSEGWNTLQCAVPTKGAALSSFEPWPTDAPISPFQSELEFENSIVPSFCTRAILGGLDIFLSTKADISYKTPGICKVYPRNAPSIWLGYPLVFEIAYDETGCTASPNDDQYRNGVNLTEYGYKKCFDTFTNDILKNCKFSNGDARGLGLYKPDNPNLWKFVGGTIFKDCMRWTMLAPKNPPMKGPNGKMVDTWGW